MDIIIVDNLKALPDRTLQLLRIANMIEMIVTVIIVAAFEILGIEMPRLHGWIPMRLLLVLGIHTAMHPAIPPRPTIQHTRLRRPHQLARVDTHLISQT
jgi:hypothetical protein